MRKTAPRTVPWGVKAEGSLGLLAGTLDPG